MCKNLHIVKYLKFIFFAVLPMTILIYGCASTSTLEGFQEKSDNSLSNLKNIVGKNHPQIALVKYNMAKTFATNGKYDKAEIYYKEALQIQDSNLRPDHPDLLKTLYGIAELDFLLEKYEDAEKYFSMVLRIKEKTLGPDHPELVTYLENIAHINKRLNKYGDAEKNYLRILSIKEKKMGSYDLEVANSLLALAVFYDRDGSYDKSTHYFKRAIEIMEKEFDINHHKMVSTRNNYNMVLKKAEDKHAAEKLQKKEENEEPKFKAVLLKSIP